MKDLTPKDFEALIGTQVVIDNPDDDLPPHNLTIIAVNELLQTDDERRNPFTVTFAGSKMIDSAGTDVMQGCFTFQGSVLDGENVFVSVNGLAPDSVEDFEYEAVFS